MIQSFSTNGWKHGHQNIPQRCLGIDLKNHEKKAQLRSQKGSKGCQVGDVINGVDVFDVTEITQNIAGAPWVFCGRCVDGDV